MRPKSWFRFWYGVARLVYIFLFAPSLLACAAFIFVWSVFRFAITLAYELMVYVLDQLIAKLES